MEFCKKNKLYNNMTFGYQANRHSCMLDTLIKSLTPSAKWYFNSHITYSFIFLSYRFHQEPSSITSILCHIQPSSLLLPPPSTSVQLSFTSTFLLHQKSAWLSLFPFWPWVYLIFLGTPRAF